MPDDEVPLQKNMPPALPTEFAPAERDSDAAVQAQVAEVGRSPIVTALLNAFDGMLVIVNARRQVVAANAEALRVAGVASISDALGLRPGEVLSCVHAHDGKGGCGTSHFCSTCGSTLAILASQESHGPAGGECLVTVDKGGRMDSLEFHVRAAPVVVGGCEFVVMSYRDITHENRRRALERVFFHDIMNTVNALYGWSRLLQDLRKDRIQASGAMIQSIVKTLVTEIEDQRNLLQAETGELKPSVQVVSANEVLSAVREIFAVHDAAEGRTLIVDDARPSVCLETGTSLLLRVVNNMVKNALEATPKGGQVRLWCEADGGEIAFRVWNREEIPPKIAMRIFQRSFSTKGTHGRGVGTYSMKLFGEKYLGGKVGFTTSKDQGTIFSIRLPAKYPEN